MSALEAVRKAFVRVTDGQLAGELDTVEARIGQLSRVGSFRDRSHAAVDGTMVNARELAKRLLSTIVTQQANGWAPLQGPLEGPFLYSETMQQIVTAAAVAGSTVEELWRELVDEFGGHHDRDWSDVAAELDELRERQRRLQVELDRRNIERELDQRRSDAEEDMSRKLAELEAQAR